MKALTLYQPYATLIGRGDKRFETRSWSTRYRGDLLIHSSATMSRSYWAFWYTDAFIALSTQMAKPPLIGIPLGVLICQARLVDVVPITQELVNRLSRKEYRFGDYSENRFAWKLEVVRIFDPPIPAKGNRMLWEYKGPLP